MGTTEDQRTKSNTDYGKNILKRVWYFLVRNNIAEISLLFVAVAIIVIVTIYSFPNEFQKLIELIFRK